VNKKFKSLTTSEDIMNSLRSFGVSSGDTVCLHVAMSSLGFIPGAARTIIESVLKVLDGGTLMMPTYSGDLSHPSEWKNPSVPDSWINKIVQATPPYNKRKTPTRKMGVVAEYFRTFPGVKRSNHPQSSFSAIGPLANKITHPHNLDNRFGLEGPLGRLYSLNGWVILIGAPWDTVSLFHLTQHMINRKKTVSKSAPLVQNKEKKWIEYSDIEHSNHWFSDAVSMLINSKIAKSGFIGNAETIIFKSKPAVDKVVNWRNEEKR
tara:strand:- start:5539 stop:6327 length:789 start_codon:yes stop_codon:yes gene_type:complete